MTRQIINIGQTPNDRTGDPLRTAFDKVNANFAELYSTDAITQYRLGDDTQFVQIELDGEDVPTGGITIQSGYNTSMPVYIKGANCADEGVGGNVVIEAGAPPLAGQLYNGTVGNIEMSANQTTIESLGNMWTFGSDGTLQLPVGGDILDSEGNTVLGGTTVDTSPYTFDSSGLSWTNPDEPPDPIGGWFASGIICMVANTGTVISNGIGGLGSQAWLFGADGNLHLPAGGDIKDSNGDTVLGGTGGGLSISDFGEGFSLNGANKIVTNKLYSTNETQPNQHYRLELDTNGVVHLPDQSIINGATLKSVPGNYAGITAGPVGKDEDSWMWVETNGAFIATDYSTNAYTWQFDNTGAVRLPDNSAEFYTPSEGEGNKNIDLYTNWFGEGSVEVFLQHNDRVSITTAQGANEWAFKNDGSLTLPNGASIVDTQYQAAAGSSYPFSQDAYGQTTLTDIAYVYIYQGVAHITDVQAGWVIHTNNGLSIPIDNIVHAGSNYELHFSSDNSTIIPTFEFPITIASSDYSAGSTGTISVGVAEKEWTFDSNGNVQLPFNGIIKDGYGHDIRRISQLVFDDQKQIVMSGNGSDIAFYLNHSTGSLAGVLYANSTDGFGLADQSGGGVSIKGYNGNKWTFGTDGRLTLAGGLYSRELPQVGNYVNGLPWTNIGSGDPQHYVFYGVNPAIQIAQSYGDLTGYTIGTDDGEFTTTIVAMDPNIGGFITVDPLPSSDLSVTFFLSSPDFVPSTINDITLNTGDQGATATWTFSQDGKLTLPTAGEIQGPTVTIKATSIINPLATKDWTFDGVGRLIFPDGTRQTTGYQVVTAPTSSKGNSNHRAGMVAFDNDNFYYCKEDYTSGVTDIWVKTAWTSTSW